MTRSPEDNEVKALAHGRRKRLERDRQLSMSKRLARVHGLSKQMTSIRGAARKHVEATPHLEVMLAVIDADPTGHSWG